MNESIEEQAAYSVVRLAQAARDTGDRFEIRYAPMQLGDATSYWHGVVWHNDERTEFKTANFMRLREYMLGAMLKP